MTKAELENLDAAIKDISERIASAQRDAVAATMAEGPLLDSGDRAGFRAQRTLRVAAETRAERLERMRSRWVEARQAA